MNPAGTPIWYELITPDPDGAARFYGAVVGWTTRPFPGGDYRVFESGGGQASGILPLSPDMAAAGVAPSWITYLGSDDVDATVAQATAAGGSTRWGPIDLPGVGRVAMIADPQGHPLYVLKPATTDGTSTVFAPETPGRCTWNELATADPADAMRFFGTVFGWHVGGAMPMGELGDYSFLHAGELMLGACMPVAPGASAGWTFYFRVPDLEAAGAAVLAGGGAILQGPMDVPDNDRILVVRDPQGATIGLVARIGGEP